VDIYELRMVNLDYLDGTLWEEWVNGTHFKLFTPPFV